MVVQALCRRTYSAEQAGNPVGWNHRVLESHTDEGEPQYEIHEVYYDELGRPVTHTVEAVKPYSEDPITLARELAMFRRALRQPILSKTLFPGEVLQALGRMALLWADITVSLYPVRQFFRALW